ncbi:DUF1811 family protein [Bacillus sp. HMF5848]|uniref:YfhH family protein n=1 Tax=Bacillus sp. HMF5848 TaxID=2495421 RepID=UPI000F78094F|nr:YfhH family protein [Bacillus sp. HMF5848]RSK26145.1 DUF1811 family protein [Bacillus sp. HMF5848]
MEKRYSQMTRYELQQEIGALKEKAMKAEQHGMVNEVAVLERKMSMAKAYLLNPDDFPSGEAYIIDGGEGELFQVEYLNGIFAWGYRTHTPNKEEALPLSMLIKKQ